MTNENKNQVTKTRTLKSMLIDKAEELDWSVEFDEGSCGRYVEFCKYSPAGEDFGFSVYFDEIEDIPDEVGKYYNSFDVDEHIEMWIEAKNNGVGGVPSIRRLVEDAEDIDEMLDELSDELYGVLNGWDDELEAAE